MSGITARYEHRTTSKAWCESPRTRAGRPRKVSRVGPRTSFNPARAAGATEYLVSQYHKCHRIPRLVRLSWPRSIPNPPVTDDTSELAWNCNKQIVWLTLHHIWLTEHLDIPILHIVFLSGYIISGYSWTHLLLFCTYAIHNNTYIHAYIHTYM